MATIKVGAHCYIYEWNLYLDQDINPADVIISRRADEVNEHRLYLGPVELEVTVPDAKIAIELTSMRYALSRSRWLVRRYEDRIRELSSQEASSDG